jgi:hypothetical protein
MVGRKSGSYSREFSTDVLYTGHIDLLFLPIGFEMSGVKIQLCVFRMEKGITVRIWGFQNNAKSSSWFTLPSNALRTRKDLEKEMFAIGIDGIRDKYVCAWRSTETSRVGGVLASKSFVEKNDSGWRKMQLLVRKCCAARIIRFFSERTWKKVGFSRHVVDAGQDEDGGES